MVRWLEANGYDVSYISGVDTDRRGALLLQHKVFMSVGHDEYWSANERANVQKARSAAVNLAFFIGNTMFWKTRWENSIDGSHQLYRTLVCYKETLAGQPIDPADPLTWTGSWRDRRFSPPADGGQPENAVTGTLYKVDAIRNDSISITAADGRMRLWRNTAAAALSGGQVYATPPGTLGYEWDIDADNGFRPAGLFDLSTTTVSISNFQYLLDYGATYGSGMATHRLTLYRYGRLGLVFGAGTVQWSWGLDSNHDNGSAAPDINMRQATVNLLADIGAQPATLQGGLLTAIPSNDTISPSSTITSPSDGTGVPAGSLITITETASDTGGGVVGGVEVSFDDGTSWHPAIGRENWSYTWTPSGAQIAKVMSRAVDDTGNLEVPSHSITLLSHCPCTIWSSTNTPVVPDFGPDGAVELGVKFRADTSGFVNGIRFYKSANNTGTHVGNLWSSTGTLLASATFSSESNSGWQQVNFSTPVAITANTVYVASYHTNIAHFSGDRYYFTNFGVDNPPLHGLASGVSGVNGVFAYGNGGIFPTQTFRNSNYWVDVVFTVSSGATTLTSITVTPRILAWR